MISVKCPKCKSVFEYQKHTKFKDKEEITVCPNCKLAKVRKVKYLVTNDYGEMELLKNTSLE